MVTKLTRIEMTAAKKPKERFTSLYHLLNDELLIECHFELDGDKACGIDEVTKREYEENLRENIRDLVSRLKKHAYIPLPVRRTYIPKGKNKVRPLGIPAYEDKIVQLALKKILEPIYEVDFMEFSFGFRPGKSCHDALRRLNTIICGKTSYVVDADIRGYFDNVNHEWLMKAIDVRIADPNIKRLIVRFFEGRYNRRGEVL
jgi:group II intron reverse transcriptase/maturase